MFILYQSFKSFSLPMSSLLCFFPSIFSSLFILGSFMFSYRDSRYKYSKGLVATHWFVCNMGLEGRMQNSRMMLLRVVSQLVLLPHKVLVQLKGKWNSCHTALTQDHLDYLRNFPCIVYYWMCLSGFLHLTKTQTYLRIGNDNEKLSQGHVCEIFSLIMVDVKGPRPLWEVTLLNIWSGQQKK